MILILTLFVILLTTLLLWGLISSRGNWTFKSFCIVFCIWFSIAINLSLSSLYGWPASDLPSEFEVKSVLIQEPSRLHNDPGAIYLWIIDLTEDNVSFFNLHYPNKDEPQAQKIAYTRARHKQAEKMKQILKKGGRVMGKKGKGNGKEGEGKGDKEGNQGEIGGDSPFESDDIIFGQVRPPRRPEK